MASRKAVTIGAHASG
jgi:sporulation protein YlmC with PRC-barrel domain